MWAVFHFPADAPHRTPDAQGPSASRPATSTRAAAARQRRTGLPGPRLRRDGAAGDRDADPPARGHRRAGRVQRELEASDERLQQILNNSSAVIFARDARTASCSSTARERVFRMKSARRRRAGSTEVRGEARAPRATVREQRAGAGAQHDDGVRGDAGTLDDGLYTYLDQVPAARRGRRLRRVRHRYPSPSASARRRIWRASASCRPSARSSRRSARCWPASRTS